MQRGYTLPLRNSANEVEPKKQMLILMNRNLITYLICCITIILMNIGFAQKNDPVDQRWEQMEKRIEYGPSRNPQGPANYYNDPPGMNEVREKSSPVTLEPHEDDIIQSREKRFAGSENQGVKKRIRDNEAQQLDDLSTPDTEAPEIDSSPSNRDYSTIDGSFWKFIFIAIGVFLLALILYHLFFKKGNFNKTAQDIAPANYHSEDLDPTTLKLSKLEIDLENAISNENYRLAIRILYTMVLKAMVEKSLIIWEKKKTNYHYLLEIKQPKEREKFTRTIRIFEWVWYGKNQLNEAEFKSADAYYRNFLKQLESE